jgi:uracil-DNA glycosylase
MDLSDKIRLCTECIDLSLVSSDRLDTCEKPYVRFGVEKKWKPDRISVLFIAESPPPNGYFYDQDEVGRSGGLRTEVLKYLGLDQSLEKFRAKGYFLLDTIKCRLKKSRSIKTPLRIAEISKNCASRFLREEIDALAPKTVFVLGKTTKQALEEFQEFEELKKHKITDEFDKNLSRYRVILCVFPGGQTRMYRNKIDQAFARIREQ